MIHAKDSLVCKEIFVKIINRSQPLTIFAKNSILYVWQGSKYSSGLHIPNFRSSL